jgi:hypothetical protein
MRPVDPKAGNIAAGRGPPAVLGARKLPRAITITKDVASGDAAKDLLTKARGLCSAW